MDRKFFWTPSTPHSPGSRRIVPPLRRVAGAQTTIDSLTPRERDVLMSLIEGQANGAIASALDISSRTVEIYRANLMAKLSVTNLSAALRVAFAAGMFPQTCLRTVGAGGVTEAA
jgi:DNA-binding NarL/FixJ family response regulator